MNLPITSVFRAIAWRAHINARWNPAAHRRAAKKFREKIGKEIDQVARSHQQAMAVNEELQGALAVAQAATVENLPAIRLDRFCACGCGQQFEPSRQNQKYKSERHRERAKNSSWVAVRIKRDQVASVKAHLLRFSRTKNGVTPLPGSELCQIRQAAFWLNNRLFEEQGK